MSIELDKDEIEKISTLFLMSCEKGELEFIKAYYNDKLKLLSVLREAQDSDGSSGFILACTNGHTDVVRFFLQDDSYANNFINKKIIGGVTGFTLACGKRHLSVVNLLLEYSMPKNAKDKNNISQTVFMLRNLHLDIDDIIDEYLDRWKKEFSNMQPQASNNAILPLVDYWQLLTNIKVCLEQLSKLPSELLPNDFELKEMKDDHKNRIKTFNDMHSKALQNKVNLALQIRQSCFNKSSDDLTKLILSYLPLEKTKPLTFSQAITSFDEKIGKNKPKNKNI